MKGMKEEDVGIRQLRDRFRKAFRTPENLQHYSEKDFREAERKFVKYCFRNGRWISL